ncbi:MAG: DUF6502 family protein [Steroidobacteraceae bacterium]
MAPTVPGLSTDARKQLLYAVRKVLWPIVRLLIRIGISYQEFADLARGVYVESAIRDRKGPAFIPTRERVVMMTGLTRQQVDYYLENEDVLPTAQPTLALIIPEVLHRWHTDPHYLGPYGIPIELEFDSPQDRSIKSIVAQVDPAASAGLVLEDLLRAGSVVHSGEKHFRALARWFVLPDALTAYRLDYFGRRLTQLARTMEYNLDPVNAEKKRLERFVFADKGLRRELLPSFEAYAHSRTTQFMSDIDDWVAHSAAKNLSGARVEAGVNVFLYVETPPDTRTLSDLVQPRREMDFALVKRSNSR